MKKFIVRFLMAVFVLLFVIGVFVLLVTNVHGAQPDWQVWKVVDLPSISTKDLRVALAEHVSELADGMLAVPRASNQVKLVKVDLLRLGFTNRVYVSWHEIVSRAKECGLAGGSRSAAAPAVHGSASWRNPWL